MNSQRAGQWPNQVAHFRVLFGSAKIAIHSISQLHDLVADEADPQLRMAITLRRAIGADRRLYQWYRDSTVGKVTKGSVTIELLDGADGNAVNRFGLSNARPVRWSGPQFDEQANLVAMEELELRYDAVIWLDF